MVKLLLHGSNQYISYTNITNVTLLETFYTHLYNNTITN